MKVLAIGDVNGAPGRAALRKYLHEIREENEIDFVIANVDNIAHGIGVTKSKIDEIKDLGIDVFTGGNHVFDKKDQYHFVGECENLLRPMNFPKILPGKGMMICESKKNHKILVVHLMGQVYLSQNVNDPFEMINDVLNSYKLKENVDAIFVDFHAEATAEKYGLAHMIDGKVSCVFGTHTHVPTADFHILSSGTAFISDIGMCGNYDSVIGMQKDGVIKNFIHKFNMCHMETAQGDGTFCAILVDINEETGLASSINLIQRGGILKQF